MRALTPKHQPKPQAAVLAVKLNERVTLATQPDGNLAALVDGYPIELGRFGAAAIKRAEGLRAGLPLKSLASATTPLAREVATLVQRLAQYGFLEYVLARGNKVLVVIEPQAADYVPQFAKLRASDRLVLSRFAYLRRRADALVLESPRATALFRICDPAIASPLVTLSTPQKIADLRQQRGFPGLELLALLADCQILFTPDAGSDGLRPSEGDAHLMLWDFHDLLFHTRSTEGRQANPLGGIYPYAGIMPPLPAERPPWPGKTIELSPLAESTEPEPAIAKLLRERHSTRDFDEAHPITLAELSQFLGTTARILERWENPLDFDGTGPLVSYTVRPYPSAGSAYELELYLAVANCADLPRGFYHYDASAHALNSIAAGGEALEAVLGAAQFAMDAATVPQVLVTVAARFGRLSWKYSAIAYSLVLKDVGVLLQTFYLTATDMGLGGCAIGTSNIDLFARLTGLPFHVEGPVGQFALGRAAKQDAPA